MEINIKNLKYKDIIDKFNIELKNNSVVAFLSKNDDCITNLFELICGRLLPDCGDIIMDEITLNKSSNKTLINKVRSMISYLDSDTRRSLFNYNIYQDIIYELDTQVDKTKLNSLLEKFELNRSILKRSYIELSDGEKKKICIIQALMKNSKIIVMNNPNVNLDYKSIQTLIKILRSEKRNGKLVLISSMDSNFVLQVADRLVIINNGKIIKDGKKYDVMKDEKSLSKVNNDIPKIINFENKVLELKKIKLGYRDNLNDLIKDIYRNAK